MTDRLPVALSPKPQTFLARASYRQRRLRDAARVLPIVGAFLVLVPLLWPRDGGPDNANGTAEATLYLFGVWFGLIVLSYILARVIDLSDDADTRPAAEQDTGNDPRAGAG
ncbi:hypothetical protein [Marivivens marinus]|uniref:hypothetical protein n=1 Tax=Marivivens marinus TaxID=3110173 RepID=UPI003B847E54